MAQGMLAILATWGLALSAFTGIGLFVQRRLRLADRGAETVVYAFWIGWSLVIITIQFWHLVAPVNAGTYWAVTIAGLAGFVWYAGPVLALLRTRPAGKVLFAFGLCLFAAWLANRAMGPISPYDAGFYHLTAIRWATSCAVVPGLGNLHQQLALNSPHFLFLALMGAGPLSEAPHHVTNGVLLLALSGQIGLSAYRVVLRRRAVRPHDLLTVLFIAPVLRQCLTHASSTSTDLPAFVLGAVVTVLLCRALFDEHDPRGLASRLVVISLLVGVGVALKLTFVVMGGTAAVIALATLVVTSKGAARPHCRRALVWAFLLAAAALAPCMAHGVILSGYVAYPCTLGAFDVEWALPRDHALSVTRWVTSWARKPNAYPNDVLNDWSWLRPWVKGIVRREGMGVVLPLLLAAAGVSAACANPRRRGAGVWLWPGTGLLLPSMAGLIFWFLSAPDPRFAGSAFWSLAAGALTVACVRWWPGRYGSVGRVLLVLSIALALGVHATKLMPLGPGSSNGYYPVPKADVVKRVTRSGLTVYVPRKGRRGWDAPLPCADVSVDPRLRLRVPDDMSKGFMIGD